LAADAADTAVRPKQASAPTPATAAARTKRDRLVAADRSIIPSPFHQLGICVGRVRPEKLIHLAAAAPESTPWPLARQGSSRVLLVDLQLELCELAPKGVVDVHIGGGQLLAIDHVGPGDVWATIIAVTVFVHLARVAGARDTLGVPQVAFVAAAQKY